MAEAKAFKLIPHCTKDTIRYEMDELVRCKDCKYYPNGDGATEWLPCREIITPPGWYCADGKKEEKRE